MLSDVNLHPYSAGGSVAVLDTTEAVDTNTAALMSFGGLAVQKDVRSGGTVYAKAFATNSGKAVQVELIRLTLG